jgi:hypothetical protein
MDARRRTTRRFLRPATAVIAGLFLAGALISSGFNEYASAEVPAPDSEFLSIQVSQTFQYDSVQSDDSGSLEIHASGSSNFSYETQMTGSSSVVAQNAVSDVFVPAGTPTVAAISNLSGSYRRHLVFNCIASASSGSADLIFSGQAQSQQIGAVVTRFRVLGPVNGQTYPASVSPTVPGLTVGGPLAIANQEGSCQGVDEPGTWPGISMSPIGEIPIVLTRAADGTYSCAPGSPPSVPGYTFVVNASCHLRSRSATSIGGTPHPATVGQPYRFKFAVSGLSPSNPPQGTSGPVVVIDGGILPPGLNLGFDGTLSGIPTTAGTFVFAATAFGRGQPATVTVSMTVSAVNGAPVAVDDVRSTTSGTALVVAGASLVENDTDADGDVLTVTGVSGATNGVVVLSSGSVTFTPTAGFVGTAGFDYTVSDGLGTAVGHVTVNVNALSRPNEPSFAGADLLSPSSVRVRWVDNATDELGYLVYRWGDNTWSPVPGCPVSTPNLSQCVDTGLTPNANYLYFVYVWNAAGYRDVGTYMHVHTGGALGAPEVNYARTAGLDSAIVGWTDRSNNELGFKVYRYVSAPVSTAGAWVLVTTAPADATSVEVSVSMSTYQFFLVSAFNAAGETYSDTYMYSSPYQPPSGVSAGAQQFTATSTVSGSGAATVTLNWQNTPSHSYFVYRFDTSGAYQLVTGPNCPYSAPVQTTCIDNGAVPGEFYQYWVYSSLSGTPGYTVVPIVVHVPKPLVAPVITDSYGGIGTATIHWVDNATDETGYVVYEYRDGAYVAVATLPPGVTTVTIPGLASQTTHVYNVAAIRGSETKYAQYPTWLATLTVTA